MAVLHANHVLSLFQSFHCDGLAELYSARDRAAGLAADALDQDVVEPVRDLQAILRAAVAVALVNELPTAVFVESGLLWRAKIDAHRRLRESSGRLAGPEPFAGLTFSLLAYPVGDLEATLVAAAALAPFRSQAHHHFASALATARELPVSDLASWAAASTLDGLAALLSRYRGAGTPMGVAPASRAAVQSSQATVESFLAVAQAVRDAYGPKSGASFITIDENSPIFSWVTHDPICARVATSPARNIRFLSFRTLFGALQGKPRPDLRQAPVAAIMHTAHEKRDLPEDDFRALVVSLASAFASPLPIHERK